MRHPIGFDKYTLPLPFGWRLRLHVWHGDGSDLPHTHRWAFAGLPLWRCFLDTRWAQTTGTTHRLMTAWPVVDGVRRYDDTGRRSGLDLMHCRTRRPLVPYLCRHGEIHSYTPLGKAVHVSLILCAPARAETSIVWERP